MRGAKAEIDLFQILMKRLTVTGSTLRGMGAVGRADGFRAIEDLVLPWLNAGSVRPVIEDVWPLEQAMDAHQKMQSGSHFGKLLLNCG